MSRPTDHEVEREARRILRKLALDGAHLSPLDAARYAVVRRGDPESGRTRIDAGIVAEFRRRDWLSPLSKAPECFALSPAGRGWIAREIAGLDGFAAQHQLLGLRPIAGENGGQQLVAVNEGESPLGWLKARGMIDGVQLEAGERLRRDFTMAQLEPRMGIDWSAPVVSGSRGSAAAASLSDIVLAAKQRFSRALSTVGPGLSDLLFEVCCHLTGLEAMESANGWPRRSGKVVLQIALDRLAAHYGLSPPCRARLRSWSAEAVKL
jgi:hypothetical protein